MHQRNVAVRGKGCGYDSGVSAPAKIVTSPAGLRAEVAASGGLRRFDCGPTSLTLFIGNEVECGPANLYLRRRGARQDWTPLLGPASPTVLGAPQSGRLAGRGAWQGIDYDISLVLAAQAPVWFWHLRLTNTSSETQELDLTYAQDVALAPYGAVRMNEYYVSQYVDHTPLFDPQRGALIASRQNQSAEGRNPWCLIGSLRKATGFATDALDFHGLATRAGQPPPGMIGDLPSRRLQHEHALAVLRDAPVRLAPGESLQAGFFGLFAPDHPQATSAADLLRLGAIWTLPEAAPDIAANRPPCAEASSDGSARTLFAASSTAGGGRPRCRCAAPPVPASMAPRGDRRARRASVVLPWRGSPRGAAGQGAAGTAPARPAAAHRPASDSG